MYSKLKAMIYYEDVKLHQKISSVEYEVTEEGIIRFASEWDPHPFHTDPDYARKTRFGGLFASGTQMIAICVKLSGQMNKQAHIAGLGFDKIRFAAPVRPGDRLHAESEVISKRQSESDPTAGIVQYATQLVNQDGKTVLAYKSASLVARHPADGFLQPTI